MIDIDKPEDRRRWLVAAAEVAKGVAEPLVELTKSSRRDVVNNLICFFVASTAYGMVTSGYQQYADSFCKRIGDLIIAAFQGTRIEHSEQFFECRLNAYLGALSRMHGGSDQLRPGCVFYACCRTSRVDFEFDDISEDLESMEYKQKILGLTEFGLKKLQKLRTDPSLPTWPTEPVMLMEIVMKLSSAYKALNERLEH